jgi:hypothetical protein
MTQEESLKYDTDKFNDHGNFSFYNKHFSNLIDVRNVLEVGVYNGGSLHFLADYFFNAHIVGVDIHDKSQYNNDRITTIECNQENRDDLNRIDGEYDLIIDDGGHTMKQQQTTFGVLFGKIRSGGIFVIEDLHTSSDSYPSWKDSNDNITTLDMVKQLQSDGVLISNHITDEERNHIIANVGLIEIFSRTECYTKSVTCVIYKR